MLQCLTHVQLCIYTSYINPKCNSAFTVISRRFVLLLQIIYTSGAPATVNTFRYRDFGKCWNLTRVEHASKNMSGERKERKLVQKRSENIWNPRKETKKEIKFGVFCRLIRSSRIDSWFVIFFLVGPIHGVFIEWCQVWSVINNAEFVICAIFVIASRR